jgi:hypothetical protein
MITEPVRWRTQSRRDWRSTVRAFLAGLVLGLFWYAPAYGQDSIEVEPFDPWILDSKISQGVFAIEAARLGELSTVPFVRIERGADVEVAGAENLGEFAPAFEVINAFERQASGTYDLTLLLGLIDHYGRLDTSTNRLLYDLEDLDQSALRATAEWLLRSQPRTETTASLAAEEQELLSEFQRANGLSVTGSLDHPSAMAMARHYSLVRVRALQSLSYYPDDPQHVIFILPYETAAKTPEKFSASFEHLPNIEQYAFNLDEFRELRENAGSYVFFVHFLEKVDPSRSIQIGLSSSATEMPKQLGTKRYALPGSWPVLTESFRIDETVARNLYLNIVLDGTVLARHKLSRAP